MAAPVLETDRLILRPHRPSDLDECAAMWSDPAVTRYISSRTFSREEAWARLLRYAGHWQWLNYGFWAIEVKGAGLFAGELGFADFQREVVPRIEFPEAGWVLASPYHGRGYGTEAVGAVLRWADARWSSTTCLIHPDNLPSLQLAAKCGYGESARTVYHGNPAIIFQRSVMK